MAISKDYLLLEAVDLPTSEIWKKTPISKNLLCSNESTQKLLIFMVTTKCQQKYIFIVKLFDTIFYNLD